MSIFLQGSGFLSEKQCREARLAQHGRDAWNRNRDLNQLPKICVSKHRQHMPRKNLAWLHHKINHQRNWNQQRFSGSTSLLCNMVTSRRWCDSWKSIIQHSKNSLYRSTSTLEHRGTSTLGGVYTPALQGACVFTAGTRQKASANSDMAHQHMCVRSPGWCTHKHTFWCCRKD